MLIKNLDRRKVNMVEIAHPSNFFAPVSSILKLCKYATLGTFLPEILNKKNFWSENLKPKLNLKPLRILIEVTMIKRDG